MKVFTVLIFLLIVACQEDKQSTFPAPSNTNPAESQTWDPQLTEEIYYDKLLGALVGSAIGDAMGAPTEMWHRHDIAVQWGYVDDLTSLIREGSAEGPWEDNLPGGSTTDDTRWKYLIGHFLISQPSRTDSLNAKTFAQYITDQYLAEIEQVKKSSSFDPQPLETQVMHIAWLQEWAKVSKAYLSTDIDQYTYALNKFYGGEMSCAGMLYAPAIGAYFPGQAQKAYLEAYRLGLFDIGYARDITGLTAAMVAEAMRQNSTFTDIVNVCRETDPLRYSNSRLVGRMSYRSYLDATYIVYEAKKIEDIDSTIETRLLNSSSRDALYLSQMTKAYTLLDEKLQDIPFHAAEIHLINLTALLFSEGDFQKGIEFVVNYGRDNDTVAAVTGAILGANIGYHKLPKLLKEKALAINKEILGLDIEKLAMDWTKRSFNK